VGKIHSNLVFLSGCFWLGVQFIGCSLPCYREQNPPTPHPELRSRSMVGDAAAARVATPVRAAVGSVTTSEGAASAGGAAGRAQTTPAAVEIPRPYSPAVLVPTPPQRRPLRAVPTVSASPEPVAAPAAPRPRPAMPPSAGHAPIRIVRSSGAARGVKAVVTTEDGFASRARQTRSKRAPKTALRFKHGGLR